MIAIPIVVWAADGDLDGLEDDDETNTYLTDPNDSDTDDDGLSDGDEVLVYFTDPLTDADLDGDGLTDASEILTHSTNHNDSDSDDDNLTDGDEINTHLTNPNDSDSDDDSLTDGDEINTGTGSSHLTDPNDSDSDEDGLTDGAEINTHTTDPNDSDSDDDSLTDGAEINTHTTDPNDSDSDDDGLTDSAEVNIHSTDPNDSDSDDDSRNDYDEVSVPPISNPNDSDSDDDGLTDGDEVSSIIGSSYVSDPTDTDTDNDLIDDFDEVVSGTGSLYVTDPGDSDTDDDGRTDYVEITIPPFTDPTDSDSDDDGLTDSAEVNIHSTDPNDTDTDDGGVDDGTEVNTDLTDPNDGGDDLDLGSCTGGSDVGTLAGPYSYGGHTYYVSNDGTQCDGEATATALGGHLVSINDSSEETFVEETLDAISSGKIAYIDGDDKDLEGTFVFLDDGYINWQSGQPDNDSGEDCAEINRFAGWNDIACSGSKASFIEIDSGGDVTAPTITNVTSDKTNGAYTVGEVIDIDVTFSEAVTSTGSVTITLETGDTDRTCTFTVSNSDTGTCNYTVQAGDTSADLTVSSISGTIADQSANAMSDFVPATNLAANKALVIDTTSPTVSITAPTEGATVSGASVSITASASDTNLVGVQFKRDTNTNIGAEDTTSTYGVTWDTTGLSDGAQSLIAVARDTAGNYATSTAVSVTVDNAVEGVTISDTAMTATEGGATDSFTIVLDTEPTHSVVFTIMTTSEATTSTHTKTFTTGNWDTPQSVTVTAINDDIDEDIEYATTTFSVSSSDGDYNGISVDEVVTTITDNDTAGFTKSTATLAVDEEDTNTFTLVLNSEPESNVVLGVSSDDTGAATVSAAEFTFTSANWDTPQIVTVTGVSDIDSDDETPTITITVDDADSDNRFDALANQTVDVTVTDDDAPDSTDPTVTVLSPVDNDTGISISSNLIITFDEDVDAESGNILIKKTSDNSTVHTIDVTGGLVSGSGSDTITINPSSDLEYDTEYYVQIATTAFDDTAGNSYAGITDTTSWSFTTGSEPVIPSGSGGGRSSSISSTCNPSDRTISVGDKVSFDIDIDTTEDSYTFKWIKVLSGDDEDESYRFKEAGKFYPRAEAKDTAGNKTTVNCGTITVEGDDEEEEGEEDDNLEEKEGDYKVQKCEPYLNSFILVGETNTSSEVKKLQQFLNKYENEDLDENGIFDNQTIAAVKRFQEKEPGVLSFWNLSLPTGNVYITTKNAINKKVCQKTLSLNCPYFTESHYSKVGDMGSKISLIKEFLNTTEDEDLNYKSELFDTELEDAVKRFQIKYSDKILTPWNISVPSGWWYKSTTKQANDNLGCFLPQRLDNGVIIE